MKRHSMRSPRRVVFEHPSLKSTKFDDSPPPNDSISWQLWHSCLDIAREALQSDYVQGIAWGNLDPWRFGQYTIQDCAFCCQAQQHCATLEQRAQDSGQGDLAAFAKARHDGYATYADQLLTAWHVSDASAILLSPATQKYVHFEHLLAERLNPAYGVLAMAPCELIWPWLASELESDEGPNNFYDFWIEVNTDWTGAYRLVNFMDAWFATHPKIYDPVLAGFVFRGCLTGELNLFRAACDQPLMKMPQPPASVAS